MIALNITNELTQESFQLIRPSYSILSIPIISPSTPTNPVRLKQCMCEKQQRCGNCSVLAVNNLTSERNNYW